uniref:Uncharacterized protein n=1 Tax=Arundo donax TaxID=35708 RepID=A0A0A9BK73_ARUDO
MWRAVYGLVAAFLIGTAVLMHWNTGSRSSEHGILVG